MEFMTALSGGYDNQKPSLFEILSENELNGLIPPSLRYLLAVATHRNPRYLLRILNNFDELYAVCSLLIERFYLRTYGGGFTENFYGLKRERVLRIKGGESTRARLGAPKEVRETLQLRDGDVWKNLAVMVGIPYIKRKLDESYDIHASGINMLGPAYRDRERYPTEGRLKEKIMWLYKWFLRKIYPTVNAAYYFSLLAFNLAYLFDGTKYHSPFMWIIGSRIRRLNDADHKAIALATEPKPAPAPRSGQTTSIFAPRTMSRVLQPKVVTALKLLLPTSIFALKFLEWWHNSDFSRQLSKKANEGLELPPPSISGVPASRQSLATFGPKKGGEEKEKERKAEFADEKGERPSSSSSRRDSGFNHGPPISATSMLPIFTVSPPAATNDEDENTTALCPICVQPVQTPTAAQTGYVYCYSCIFKWVDGSHPRQEAFMEGSGEEEGARGWVEEGGGSRREKWESGAGRDAVTGRRILGGTSGLRRVMV
ncbi:Putative peroxisome assembly protein [Septoria linicola]|uniref:Peroxisome assembly protein 12 n=1 Tax=Septoria linicola TaxID=215465 RepID=A0A9Q9B0Y7_9PEZI|nr:putative peroxisome assembly protein [Septoria linicola]USW56903.1 Putative peroxisome assembly protein [Septoria linicola]